MKVIVGNNKGYLETDFFFKLFQKDLSFPRLQNAPETLNISRKNIISKKNESGHG